MLLRSGHNGEVAEAARVRLPGPAILGEGKPENQNVGLPFTRGEICCLVDMNQDGVSRATARQPPLCVLVIHVFVCGLPKTRDHPHINFAHMDSNFAFGLSVAPIEIATNSMLPRVPTTCTHPVAKAWQAVLRIGQCIENTECVANTW